MDSSVGTISKTGVTGGGGCGCGQAAAAAAAASGAAPTRRQAVVVGGATVDMTSRPAKGTPLLAHTSSPGEVTQRPGGVARNIAEACARCGRLPACCRGALPCFGKHTDNVCACECL
jgi:hypothetical protein